jgi:hypothetical protein
MAVEEEEKAKRLLFLPKHKSLVKCIKMKLCLFIYSHTFQVNIVVLTECKFTREFKDFLALSISHTFPPRISFYTLMK